MKASSISTAQIQILPSRTFEFKLESLRGIAALTVVVFHVFDIKYILDSRYTPKGLNFLPGHSSVLIFFILSGFVIGITNTRKLSGETILGYIRKRLIRLYPIYITSLIVTLLVVENNYPISTIIGNFVFLQNSIVPVFSENVPLWSLNSEVLYYLWFIPISYFGLASEKIGYFAALGGIVCGLLLNMPLLSSYCFGFVFWTCGLWISKSNHFQKKYASSSELVALVLLFLGGEALNPFNTAVVIMDTKLHIHFAQHYGPAISLKDLLYLPFCFYIFLRFTDKDIKYGRLILVSSIFAGTSYFVYMIFRYGLESEQIYFLTLPMMLFTAGAVLLVVSQIKTQPNKILTLPALFTKLGSISYGIYVIHLPVSVAISHISAFSGSAKTFMVRLLVYLILVIFFGYLLELKLQPWIRKFFDKKLIIT